MIFFTTNYYFPHFAYFLNLTQPFFLWMLKPIFTNLLLFIFTLVVKMQGHIDTVIIHSKNQNVNLLLNEKQGAYWCIKKGRIILRRKLSNKGI